MKKPRQELVITPKKVTGNNGVPHSNSVLFVLLLNE